MDSANITDLSRELGSIDDEIRPSESPVEFRGVLQRLRELASQLEQIQMKGDTTGVGIDHSLVGVAAELEVPVVPIDEAKTAQGLIRQRNLGAVGTRLKLLSAQLHGLRGEFKATELHNAGGLVDRSVLLAAYANRPTLDVEISQVIDMIFDARQVLYGPVSSVSIGSGAFATCVGVYLGLLLRQVHTFPEQIFMVLGRNSSSRTEHNQSSQGAETEQLHHNRTRFIE